MQPSSSPPPIDWPLLDRVLSGHGSPEERLEVESLLQARPELKAGLASLRAQWNTPPGHHTIRSAGQSLAALTARISAEDESSPGPRLQSATSRSAKIGYAFASVALGIALLFIGWQSGRYFTESPSTVTTSTYTRGAGQRATVTLPDGSTAILNVASTLEVPTNYRTGNRTVRLVGEALFTVTHQQGVPFTVVAGSSITRVLGTSFSVRHYATDSVATVAVRDGRVAVNSVILNAQQQVSVDTRGVRDIRPADNTQFSFASGILALNSVPLSSAVTELNRWYDVDIRLGDSSLRSLRITGEYGTGSIADLEEILGLTFNVRVVRDGPSLTLYRK